MKDYLDIIHTKYPFPSNFPKMSNEHRAMQFMPFAALKDYDESIKKAGAFLINEIYLDENYIAEINSTLNYINEHIKDNLLCEITYQNKNKTKNIKGNIKKIDEIDHFIYFNDKSKINIKDIINIKVIN